jgi:hypothetical protein
LSQHVDHQRRDVGRFCNEPTGPSSSASRILASSQGFAWGIQLMARSAISVGRGCAVADAQVCVRCEESCLQTWRFLRRDETEMACAIHSNIGI